MDVLRAVRKAISQGTALELLDDDGAAASVEVATSLNIAGSTWPLTVPTAFEGSTGPADLKTIVNAWVTRELTAAEYVSISAERGIHNLPFLERTDLLAWLDGSSDESEYIQIAAAGFAATASLGCAEHVIADHISVLHGAKPVDFGAVARLARTMSSTAPSASTKPTQPTQSNGTRSSRKPKEAIILLSPSPSSLLNMANVREFLENGKFDPVLRTSTTPNVQRITRKSKTLGTIRVLVADSAAQFKPEYWDRVVAVFVTGQSWQLRQYKWPDAHTLFTHVLGFSLVYKNDPVPPSLKQWNVRIEPIDRTQRFRDREVVERIWEHIEKSMIANEWASKV